MAITTDSSNINDQLGSGGTFFFAYTDIGSLISSIIGLVLTVSGLALLLYLAYGGMQWLTAGGDKQKIEQAQQILTNALIGLTIVVASWAVYQLVIYFFQLESIVLVN